MVLAVLYDAVAADETNFQSLAVAVAYNRSGCNGVGNAGTCALVGHLGNVVTPG